MMKKKYLSVAAALLAVAMVGCKKSESAETVEAEPEAAVVETTPEPTEEPEKSEAMSLLEQGTELVKDSNWSGVDPRSYGYVLDIKDGLYNLTVQTPEGDVSEFKGDLTVDLGDTPDSVNVVMESEEVQKFLESSTFELFMRDGEPYLRLNDVTLTRSDIVEMQKMEMARLLHEYLAEGHVWMSCKGETVTLLYLDDVNLYLEKVVKNGDQFDHTVLTGEWALNELALCIFSDAVSNYTWDLTEDGEFPIVQLQEDGENFSFYPTSLQSLEDGEAMAEMYLENQTVRSDDDELSTLLTGYEGCSIVEAFIIAGLDPSIENRGVYAEKLDIENYTGTPEQNLYMLETMGATLVLPEE